MLGIIILNYKNWNATYKCIRSIFDTANNVNYHIYLVDNNSPNDPPDHLLNLIERSNTITFVKNKKNRGYAAGNNIGIKLALSDKCNYILISNSDIIYLKNSIALMLDFLKNNPEVGIVGPKIYDINGELQYPSMLIKTGLKEKYLVRTFLRHIFKNVARKYYCYKNISEPIFVHAVLGACFMLSRDCALAVTPLDENTFLYEEELILGIKMEATQFKTVYYPSSEVIHDQGSSTKHLKAFSFICFVESEIYYCKRYLKANVIQVFPLYLIRSISFIIRAIKYKDFRKYILKYFNRTFYKLLKKYNN